MNHLTERATGPARRRDHRFAERRPELLADQAARLERLVGQFTV